MMSTAFISEKTKETALLRGFTLMKIPLIAFLGPRVDRIDDDRVEITIPLTYRSKNHLGSMYFGALATGADLSLGYLAFREFKRRGAKISLVFKSFSAQFLKRAEADVTFVFTEAKQLHAMIDECLSVPERITRPFTMIATTPSLSGDEPIANFQMELSLKRVL